MKVWNARRMMPTAEIARTKSKVTCSHCGGHDHYISTCNKMHLEFPPRKKAKSKESKTTAEPRGTKKGAT